MGVDALSGLASSLYSLPAKTTSFVHAACSKLDLEDARITYDRTVTKLNNLGTELSSHLKQYEPGSEEYNQMVQKTHDLYSKTIEDMTEAEAQLIACHVDPATLPTQLSPLAYQIATIPEFGLMAAGMTVAGLAGGIVFSKYFKTVFRYGEKQC